MERAGNSAAWLPLTAKRATLLTSSAKMADLRCLLIVVSCADDVAIKSGIRESAKPPPANKSSGLLALRCPGRSTVSFWPMATDAGANRLLSSGVVSAA